VGGLGTYETCHMSDFLFCFLRHVPRSHFLTDRDDLYAKTRVYGCHKIFIFADFERWLIFYDNETECSFVCFISN